MSFQRPGLVNSGTGPSSATYSEFLKDIYSSLRTLTIGLNNINQRLDTFTQQFQSLDARLEKHDQLAHIISDKLDMLVQQRENQQIRQTTNGLSLLSELDTLGSRQVEPSTGLAQLGMRTDKLISSSCLLSKLSFQLPGIPELSGIHESPESGIIVPQTLHQIPDIIIHETSTGLPNNGPSTEVSNPAEPASKQLGTNFLILD